ncbi:hypothetical protein INT47_001355 [Mucor saturninus]|uniref:J domain-containing protein n=1 Tax=Mucor saturninus TaxID=64648 RepID=A0A8H7QXX1_9FUNG|nr:hypothetical protein INT47_001355 [Mucor saturninus]
MVLPQLYRTWHWRQDHLELFDLSTALQKNNTDFYAWLGVEPTATTAEISKAHRQLVLKLHPETSAEPAEKFEITNKVAYMLRTPQLRSVYNDILQQGHLPFFKGVFYYYTRYKLVCMGILICVAVTLLDYLKAWEKYFTEKITIEQFILNAKSMAQKMSAKHASAKTHKSFIDLGDRTLNCEITEAKEIFILNEKNERVPLTVAHILPMPSIWDTLLMRIPKKYMFP